YLEKRYSSRAVRKIGSILFIVHTLLYLGVALYGPSLALGSVTGLPVWSSILLNGAVCTFYTSIGGIKAVVWTDVVQVVLIYIAYIMVIGSGLHYLGGFSAMWQIAGDGGRLIFTNFSLSPYETYTTWTMVFGWTVTWMGMYCANQTQAQRYASIGSLKGARIALLLNIPGTILNVTMAVLSGLTLYAVYGNCDPRLTGDIRKADQLVPYIVQDMLHQYPGLSGLLATAVYSSSLSTLSSGYNSLAAVTWEDFMRPWIKSSEATTLRITKLTAASYGLLSIAVAVLVGTMESIVQAASSLSGALCGPMVAVFVLGFLFPCCRKKGVIVGTLVSIVISGWMSLGSILHPRKPYTLPTTTAGCSHFNETITSGSYESPPWPSGIYQLYHISFMWVAFVGFVVHLAVSLAVSLAFEWREPEVVDPTYVCPLVRKYMRNKPETSNEWDEKINEKLSMVRMDKDIFYGMRGTDRGVALVPLHPSGSELDSSDDDTSDETVHADASEAPPRQDHSMTSSPDRSTTASPERCRLSLSASRSCPPSKKAKGRNRALAPVSDDEDDSDKASKVPSKKPRKWNKIDIPKIQVPEKIHDPVYEVKLPYAYFTYMFTDKLVNLITFLTNLYGTQLQGKSMATSAE
ncbi:hypothetical protein MRX96_045483, partial [Rhipicephalus microplus]